jgi:hypothetical protein
MIAALKDAFFSQQLKPGDVIVERQLAQQMNIGSPAVREGSGATRLFQIGSCGRHWRELSYGSLTNRPELAILRCS